MNAYLESVFAAADTQGGSLPPTAANSIRARIALRHATLAKLVFGQFLIVAIVLAVGGAAIVTAGVLSQDATVILTGFVVLAAGGICVVLNRPRLAMDTVNAASQGVDQLINGYVTDFQRTHGEFAASQRNRFAAAIDQAVAGGATLPQIRAETHSGLAYVNERLAALRDRRAAIQQTFETRAAEFSRQRDRLALSSRSTVARVLPWRIYRAAATALNALLKLGEARAELAMTDATIAIWAATQEALAGLAQASDVTLPSAAATDPVPAWLGMAVPSPEVIENAAIAKARACLPDIRARVLRALANKERTEDAILREAKALFVGDVPWPETIASYVHGLNGALPGLCESLVNASAPLLPTERTPGRKRNRRSFLIGGNLAHSPLVAEIRKRLPDDEAVETIDGPATECFLVTYEAGIPYAEIPEARLSLERYRAMPDADRDRITAAVPFELVQNYHPERAHARADSIRLACVALALRVFSRTGDQRYNHGRKTIAKGFEALIAALTHNAHVTDLVRAAVDKAKAAAGIEQTVARLKEALTTPEKFVPADAVEIFGDNLHAEIVAVQGTALVPAS